MLQQSLNWIYSLINNIINWLLSMNIVQGVSIGALMIALFVSGIVISNLIIIARR